jgi:hypothetical protein
VHRVYDAAEILSLVCDGITMRRVVFGRDALIDELLELDGERAAADAVERSLELAESAGAGEEVADDEHGPRVGQKIGDLGDRACLRWAF